ncbi:MAG TPA: ROK family protein [Firmicutes bacterium]|nr:ROK family protein [Bacillota bacterium]
MRKTINQELMRNINKELVFRCIKDNLIISKKIIAEKLGLSTTTVATIINELLAGNKIQSCGSAKSTGGRKSILYEVNPTSGYAVGIDLQVDQIVYVLLDFAGNVVSTKKTDLTDKSEWAVAAVLNKEIPEFVVENGISMEKILGIGLGVPGTVHGQSEIIEFAPNLEWENVNLRSLLKCKTPIIVENEANAAALGEKGFGVGRNVANMVYVSVGMGVGCGIIIDHKLFSGTSFNAGEFGHMTVEPDGLPCKCGKRGCWEVYASNNAALNLYAAKSGEYFDKFEDFIQRLMVGEKIASEVADHIAKYLGVGIGNIVNGLNPQLVVIGGKITETGDMIYDKILQQIKYHTLRRSMTELEIQFSALNSKASAMGAAGRVLDEAIKML